MNGCIEQVRKPRLREVSDLAQQRREFRCCLTPELDGASPPNAREGGGELTHPTELTAVVRNSRTDSKNGQMDSGESDVLFSLFKGLNHNSELSWEADLNV